MHCDARTDLELALARALAVEGRGTEALPVGQVKIGSSAIFGRCRDAMSIHHIGAQDVSIFGLYFASTLFNKGEDNEIIILVGNT